jgi:hypothetical protein
MSTTFNVIPVTTKDVTFRQVLDLAQKRIRSFFNEIGITQPITLNVNLHDNHKKYLNEIDLDSKFEWKENEYVWFSVNGILGGTDAYCNSIYDNELDPKNPWWWFDDMVANNSVIENFKEKVSRAKKLNRTWQFRRGISQSTPVINICYGLISASVAELTGGFIWTDDGAWNHKKFPCEPLEFYKWYFKPEFEDDPDCKDWAFRCLDGIENEFTAAKSTLPKAKPTWLQKLFGSE